MQTTPKLKVLDLFSGIGGFSLGLERTGGFVTEAFCEIEPYCTAVLNKHWPGVPVHRDVRSLTIQPGEFNVITGGFPCQDISLAGKGAGLSGERSGLWREFLRLIKEGQPDFVVIENSPALRSRGLAEVLRGLSEIGYAAEWHCIPAATLGAQHIRDRVWVIAYPDQARLEGRGDTGTYNSKEPLRLVLGPSHLLKVQRLEHGSPSDLGRDFHGIPRRVDRVSALGNTVIPQIPEAIGYAILNWLDIAHR